MGRPFGRPTENSQPSSLAAMRDPLLLSLHHQEESDEERGTSGKMAGGGVCLVL